MAPGPSRIRPPRDEGAGCVDAVELTAFAADETAASGLPAGRRAAISRHLLRCARCRSALDREQAMFARLRGFASGPTWEDDLAAAELAFAARGRARRRGALVGAAAAAALVVALWAVPTESPPGRGGEASITARTTPASGAPASAEPAPLAPAAESALLRAQASDGRWHATTGDDRHDVGATGLAVLALARSQASALRSATASPATRAVAQGVRWLEARMSSGGSGHDAAARRDRAVAAAALLEVHAATGERALRTAVDRALRAVSQDAHDADAAWSRNTLARARDLGWPVRVGAEAAAGSSTSPGADGGTSLLSSFSTVLAFVDSTPLR